ncbi:MAG: VCBS repeat-containing protein [Candidatus Eisenbacteria bacterium]|uniref:VCBS repeat-containing protein n=1 Tax=Eiseniibacteriota bacterium TaxID=2212470 RepID=A0A933SCI3_UNCEI|nr:VCBS repeat-containing protein [Candidatus Eisenbacteria bacterium]
MRAPRIPAAALFLSALLIVAPVASRRGFALCGLPGTLGDAGVTATGDRPTVMAAADMDGDGFDELVLSEEGSGRIAVYAIFAGAAGGTRRGFVRLYDVGGFDRPSQIVARDFDSDGIADVLVATRGSDGVVLCKGTRSGVRPGLTSPVALAGTSDARGVVVADFNHDGLPDLAVACAAGVITLRGQGVSGVADGTFSAPFATLATAATGLWSCIATGDMNRDGAFDLIGCSNSPNQIRYLMGAGGAGGGNGLFGNLQTTPNLSETTSLLLRDVTGDGKLDVLLPGNSAGAAVATNRTPDFVFTLSLQPVSFGSDVGEPPSLAYGAADLDGDGLPDLVYSRGVRSTLRVSRGILDGPLYVAFDTWDSPAIDSPSGLLLHDFDRDGAPDVAVVSTANDVVALLPGVCSHDPQGQGWLTCEALGPGTVTSSPAPGLLPLGTSVSLEAVPDAGAQFVGWTGAATGVAPVTTTTIDGHRVAQAWFAHSTHALDVGVQGAGSVRRVPALDRYPHGSVAKLYAQPDPHQEFVRWTGDVESDSAGAVIVMSGDHAVTANFTQTLYTVTVRGPYDFDPRPIPCSFDPPGGRYPFGAVVRVTALPDPGMSFFGWLLGGRFVPGNPLTVTVAGDTTLYAGFTPIQYWPEFTQIGFGEVWWWPYHWVQYGDSVTAQAVPAEGYDFVGWSGDVVDTARWIRFAVTSNVRITAHFSSSPSYAPHIVSVRDVALDQGGRVKVSWQRSAFDQAGAGANARVGEYRVWRGLDESDALAALRDGGARWWSENPVAPGERQLRQVRYFGQTTYWELVGASPASALEGYGMVFSTQHDATPSRPAPWVRTFVQAVSRDGAIWWNSPVDSGLSRDNLPPDPPSSPALLWLTSEYDLRWVPSTAPDLAGYRVYLGDSPGFVTDSSSFAAFTIEPRVRVPVVGGRARVARVRAVDVHENESAALEAVPPTLDAAAALPTLSLRLAHANPCRGEVAVEYALDRAQEADLRLFDVSGRLVCGRRLPGVIGAAGPLSLSPGRPLAAGLYFVALQQGSRVLRARVVVVP